MKSKHKHDRDEVIFIDNRTHPPMKGDSLDCTILPLLRVRPSWQGERIGVDELRRRLENGLDLWTGKPLDKLPKQ